MINNLGTPNQKASYSRLGDAMEEAHKLLKSNSISESERKDKLDAIDRMCHVASEMTKARAMEILAARVTNGRIRNIESKSLDEIPDAEVIEPVNKFNIIRK